MDVPGLLSPLYADLLTDTPWIRFLAALGEALPCRHPTIVARSPRTDDPGLLVSSEPDHGGATPYRRWLFDQTPFRDLPIGKVHTLRSMMTDAQLAALPYYRDFLAPAGILDLFAVDLTDPRSGLSLRLRGSRIEGSNRFTPNETAAVEELLPHLQAALEIHGRLVGQRSLAALYERSAERLGIGMALLTETRRVVFANAVLRIMQRHGCPLRLQRDAVAAVPAEQDGRLQAALGRLLDPTGEAGAGLHMLLDERGGSRAWSLLAEPFPDSIAADPGARPAIMLLVRAPGHFRPATAEQLGRQFGFTPAEAALALQVAQGRTVEEAAGVIGISRNTARNQLGAVFSKAGVNRQAELVRMILEVGVNLWPVSTEDETEPPA